MKQLNILLSLLILRLSEKILSKKIIIQEEIYFDDIPKLITEDILCLKAGHQLIQETYKPKMTHEVFKKPEIQEHINWRQNSVRSMKETSAGISTEKGILRISKLKNSVILKRIEYSVTYFDSVWNCEATYNIYYEWVK